MYNKRNNKYNKNKNYQKKDDRNNTNEEIVSYIYEKLGDLSKYNFEIIDNENQLSKFITNKYFLTHNYYGKNSFLIFVKIKGRYYSCVIDRRTMSYDKSKLNLQKLDIIHFNVDVNEKIFDGSIFDGTYNKVNNDHVFTISDIFYFNGEDYRKTNYDFKMTELKLYLDDIGSHIVSKKFRINKRYELNLELNEYTTIQNIRDFTEKKVHSRGLCFYPEETGTKLIYNFNHNSNKKAELPKTNNFINKKTPKLIKVVFTSKSSEPVYAVLQMKTTSIPDNYKMFALEEIDCDGYVKHKKFGMDIAYIPDIDKSIWCKDITNNSPKGTVMVKCLWVNEKKKWMPIELSNQKLPTSMNEIRKDLLEIEDSDSESDIDI